MRKSRQLGETFSMGMCPKLGHISFWPSTEIPDKLSGISQKPTRKSGQVGPTFIAISQDNFRTSCPEVGDQRRGPTSAQVEQK